ncbi:hypothetical protein [Microvirga alba]|uniref:Uncharacterized protein n=1 Tax=Microvirga alba TaxID=2791025 RepID=A0A931FRS3_9HYPH|nr:hypothetical protein [Microvirga alba]MBF9234848.1 hypothetical protein [Microvirga alba]
MKLLAVLWRGEKKDPATFLVRALQSEVASSATIEAQILNGRSTGFGLVYTNPGHGRICHTVPEDPEAHQVAVLRKTDTVFHVSAKDVVFTKMSLDDAFAD